MSASILIVEDEVIIAADLAAKLEHLGWRVVGSAVSGEEAIELARETLPEVILMDVRLEGGMDGIAAAEKIRSERDVPVIFLTAHSDPSTLDRAKITGPSGYLLKPFNERELEICIQMALYKHRAEAALREKEATLRGFYDSAPLLMGVAEIADGRTIAISGNRAIAKFLAKQPDELPGKSGIELGTPVQFDQVLIEHYRRSQQEKAPVSFEYAYVREGMQRWLRTTVAFIGMGPSGNPRFSFVAEDITERKQAELELKDAQARLQRHADELERVVDERTAELRKANKQLRVEARERLRLETEMLNLSHEERLRIAADLHDGVCQSMVGLAYIMSILKEDLGRAGQPEPATRVEAFKEQLLEIAQQTRVLARGMSPVVPEGTGLIDALHELAANTRALHRIDCSIESPADVVVDNSRTATELFNIAQEAVRNAVRHGGSTRIQIELRPDGKWLKLAIRDNGAGLADGAERSGGLGLRAMRYRATSLGGEVSVRNRKSKGTEVFCRVPNHAGKPRPLPISSSDSVTGTAAPSH